MNDIVMQDVQKKFLLPIGNKEDLSTFKKFFNYFFPKYETINALKEINFTIDRGERIALIGPNGAGKSTTMKILTGIMRHNNGTVKVLGKDPFTYRQQLANEIGVIFGHCSQLWTHLPVLQSYNMLSAIYNLSKARFKAKLSELVAKFDIEYLLEKPVNKLSLGERMKCEIVASLLHSPKILLFDEPTIGLDIIAKSNLRDIIIKLVAENNNTLLLTSHDVNDIERICERVIIINKGEVVVNNTINEVKSKYTKNIIISIISDNLIKDWSYPGTQVVKQEQHNLKVNVDLATVSKEEVAYKLLEKYIVKDLSFEHPSLENIIRNFYEHYAR
jgi:ABC-2 type transport system ATP-binding protein